MLGILCAFTNSVYQAFSLTEGLGMRLTMPVIEFLAAVGFVDDATTARELVLPVEELSCTYTVLVTSQAEGLVFWLNIFVSSSWE